MVRKTAARDAEVGDLIMEPFRALREYEQLIKEFDVAPTRAQQVYTMDPDAARAMEVGLRNVLATEILRIRKNMRASGWVSVPPLPQALAHLYEVSECGHCGKAITEAHIANSAGGLTAFIVGPCGHCVWLMDDEQLQAWWSVDKEEARARIQKRARQPLAETDHDEERRRLHLARFKHLRAEVSSVHRVRWGGPGDVYAAQHEAVARLNAVDLAKRRAAQGG